ncbi:WD domain-containing protein isoform 2 [Cladophialophora immunda]|nr:WD domain-containing protein isoform 2 [Cladophialophora immunda]
MEHENIASLSLQDQWRQLVLKPLTKLGDGLRLSSYLVVIDALDECDDAIKIQIILQLLAEAQSLKTVQLRSLITSRPTTPINVGFNRIPEAGHQDYILDDTSQEIVNHAIAIFLEHHLKATALSQNLNPHWPGQEAIKRLVQKADGLFIWAATAYRFIHEGRRFADKRLRTVLEDSHVPFAKQLSGIYTSILRQSIHDSNTEEEEYLYTNLRLILGSIVVLSSPLSATSLSRLLCITDQEIYDILNDLHSILEVPRDQRRPIRLFHLSFREFLLSKDQCTDLNFWVDEKQAHRTLAACCIRLMSTSLKQDICGRSAPGFPVTEMQSQVDQYIPAEVQYASLYWVQHLQRYGAQLCDNDDVYQFLRKHLLHWLEALSWTGQLSTAVHAIASLESIALKHSCPDLLEFIHEAKRFVLYNRSVIEQAPLQAYCSALIFAPAVSMVRTQLIHLLPRWVKTLPEVQKGWSALLQTLEGHAGPVNTVTFAPDGAMLASASDDQTIKLWDARTGGIVQTLQGHSNSVRAVAFSPDGKVLVSASSDKTVRLWKIDAGVVIHTLHGHSKSVRAVVFSPDNTLLASASWDKTVRLWDATSGEAVRKLEGHSRSINAVSFLPEGIVLASASKDGTVKLWDVGTGAIIRTLQCHSDYISAVTASPDGVLLASASYDETVKIWEADTGEEIWTCKGHTKPVSAITFSPTGKALASAAWDKTARLWDTGTGKQSQILQGHLDYVNAVAFSPDNKLLSSASDDGTIRMWEVSSKSDMWVPQGVSSSVNAIVFSPDGKLVVSASGHGTVNLWDADTGALVRTLKEHSESVNAVAFSPDGNVLASVSSDGMISLWKTSTAVVIWELQGHLESVRAITFSPDGRLLASASSDGAIRLWNSDEGVIVQTLQGHLRSVNTVAFSPDGKVLASASNDETVKLWETSTGEVGYTFRGHSRPVISVAFSQDGKLLASGSWDRTIKLLDIDTRVAIRTFNGHSNCVSAVAFSSDSKLLASASWDKTVMLWESESGALLQKLEVDAIVQTMSFSDDGTSLTTNRGRLHAASISHSAIPRRLHLSADIFVKEEWVTRGMENMLWLPPEYRPSCAAVHGNIVALGHASGGVSILGFQF